MPEANQHVLRVGLTGGIASGKTTVANLFAARGVTVIDTDVIARQLAEPGRAGYQEIIAQFGATILRADGTIDRGALRKLVFAEPDARQRLEKILHPLIRQTVIEKVASIADGYVVIAVPLLVESGFVDIVDRVLVVDCPEEIQRRRVILRDGETEQTANLIIDAQASRAERLRVADDIITNDKDVAHLEQAVDELHRQYLSLSTK